MIPLLDLNRQYLSLKKEIQEAIQKILDRQIFILGEEVDAFEKEVANFIGVKHAVTCASGTDAIHLALRALDIQPGDEIITNAFSFIASAEAILYTGATPVFADITTDTFTLEPTAVSDLIGPRTRAILAVHLYGHPNNMDALNTICREHNLYCIEDCAQAFGARYAKQYIGGLSTIGCHSFYPTKNLGAYGDGGMLTTNDTELAKKLILLRNHYDSGNYHHTGIGYNSRLDEIQAAVLRVKLKYLTAANEKRRQIAQFYNNRLSSLVKTPTTADNCTHAFHQYTICSPQRDLIQATLAKQQIHSRIYYPVPLPDQPALKGHCRHGNYPHTQTAAAECLSIPIYPELSDDEAEQVTTVIINALT